MSQFSVYINPPEYLGQWLRHDFWDVESKRVVFPRGSAPRAVLASLLRKAPAHFIPDSNPALIPVEVPSFKGLNPATFNYLSPTGQTALISACKNSFRLLSSMSCTSCSATTCRSLTSFMNLWIGTELTAPSATGKPSAVMYSRMRKKSQAHSS